MEDIATLEHLQHLHFDPKEISVEDYTKLLKLLQRLTSLSVCLNPLYWSQSKMLKLPLYAELVELMSAYKNMQFSIYTTTVETVS